MNTNSCNIVSKTSYGIIAIKIINLTAHMLLVRRKFSIHLCEILYGTSKITPVYLKYICKQLTKDELKLLLYTPIKNIWKLIFESDCCPSNRKLKRINWRKNKIKRRFNKIRKIPELRNVVLRTKPKYSEPEWGIPKGRKKNKYEEPLNIAKREFIEETGYTKFMIIPGETYKYVESYISSNNIRYNNIYYLALMDSNIQNPILDPNNIYQKFEISKIKWVPIQKAHLYIRNDYKSKLNCINQIKNLFSNN